MANTKDNNFLMAMEQKLFDRRIIFLEGDISAESANEFLKKLLLLSLDNADPIKVIVSSKGGDVDSGLMIIDAIRSSDISIETYCLDRAYSMGAAIFLAGTGGRFMFPHSKLMLHQPYVKEMKGGDTKHLISMYESLLAKTKEFDKLISELTNQPVDEIEYALSFDHYFNPEDAIAFGFSDATIGMDILLLNRI